VRVALRLGARMTMNRCAVPLVGMSPHNGTVEQKRDTESSGPSTRSDAPGALEAAGSATAEVIGEVKTWPPTALHFLTYDHPARAGKHWTERRLR